MDFKSKVTSLSLASALRLLVIRRASKHSHFFWMLKSQFQIIFQHNSLTGYLNYCIFRIHGVKRRNFSPLTECASSYAATDTGLEFTGAFAEKSFHSPAFSGAQFLFTTSNFFNPPFTGSPSEILDFYWFLLTMVPNPMGTSVAA